MINTETLLKMTMEELSELLTKKVSSIKFTSPHDEEVRYRMFMKISSCFDKPFRISEKNRHNYFSHLRLCLELPYQGGLIFKYIEMNNKVKNLILKDLLSEENIVLESKKTNEYYPNLNNGIKKIRKIFE
jgi:hypothetical protein